MGNYGGDPAGEYPPTMPIGFSDDPSQQFIPVLYQSQQDPRRTLLLYYAPLPPTANQQGSVYEDGATKVKEEARGFSRLMNIVIPRPNPSGAPVAGVGKVFLEYSTLGGSTKAKEWMHRRWFRRKQIIAEFYPENKFADGL